MSGICSRHQHHEPGCSLCERSESDLRRIVTDIIKIVCADRNACYSSPEDADRLGPIVDRIGELYLAYRRKLGNEAAAEQARVDVIMEWLKGECSSISG
jgi:hypothetical protein